MKYRIARPNPMSFSRNRRNISAFSAPLAVSVYGGWRLSWAVFLLAVAGFQCVPDTSNGKTRVSRKNLQIAELAGQYFSTSGSSTNFIHMSEESRLAIIESLRRRAPEGSELVFFRIDNTGRFIPVSGVEDVDGKLASCGLTSTEIQRVKAWVTTHLDPARNLDDWKKPPTPDEMKRLARCSGSGHGAVLNSSRYDVHAVACFELDRASGEEIYHAACCLILSPVKGKTTR